MVKDANTEDLCRLCQSIGALAVLPRWSRISGWMVVQEDDGGRVLQDGRLENLPRVHNRGGEASHADRMVADGPVLAVECDYKKELAVEGGKLLAEILEKVAGVLESWIAGEGALGLLHQHYPVPGEQVLEFLHG